MVDQVLVGVFGDMAVSWDCSAGQQKAPQVESERSVSLYKPIMFNAHLLVVVRVFVVWVVSMSV